MFKIEFLHININLPEVQLLMPQLKLRGFDKKFVLLQVLLHEIAHYKQFRRFKHHWRALDKYKKYCGKRKDYVEKVSDRYARIYYRRIYDKVQK